jgi:hypothetical protein
MIAKCQGFLKVGVVPNNYCQKFNANSAKGRMMRDLMDLFVPFPCGYDVANSCRSR